MSARAHSGSAPTAHVPSGKLGLKISDIPPHKVLSVTDLMNQDGEIINHQVQVSKCLCALVRELRASTWAHSL
jgi:hypothetical protein